MDGTRFDTLTRVLHDARSRRGVFSGLLVGTLALVGVSVEDATAKNCKKIQNKAKRKKCLAKAKGASPPPPSCPEGQRLCRGACLSVLICCDASDCAGGRTCQAGTCACPADTPHVCAGSTVCRQCCVKADCTSLPLSGEGISECVSGVCTCPQPRTRLCPGTNGRCGTCCDSAECTNEQICYSFSGESKMACSCSRSQNDCTVAGRSGCVPPTCPCGEPCDPEDEIPCACPTELVCVRDPSTPDGSGVCAPH
jgi:hypothetical protein